MTRTPATAPRSRSERGAPHRSPLSPVLFALGLFMALSGTSQGAPALDPVRFLTGIDSLRAVARIPGLSVAVVVDGHVVLAAGLGLADLEAARPATAETPFDIASVTKPLAAVTLLRLVEEGRIDLDAPMAASSDWESFCDEFREQPTIFARGLVCQPPVHSLRHLLTHTAVGVPGTRFSYNPVLFSWASRPVAAATDSAFSDVLARVVLHPAGMTRSARRHRALPLPGRIAAELAQPYHLDSTGAFVRSPGPRPQGDGAAGGVISTVLDLARFDQALDDGRLLTPAGRNALFTPHRANDGTPQPYGLGWFLEERDGRRLAWHTGLWEGAWSAIYLKLPDEGRTLILLANSDGLWWDNPLDAARAIDSPFVRLFLEATRQALGSGRSLPAPGPTGRMPMELRQATPDDLAAVADFIVRMNARPDQRCLHSGSDPDGVLRDIEAFGRPPEESILLAVDGDRLVGLVAADFAVEQGRGWLWGPFADVDEPVPLAERLVADLVGRAPPDIHMIDCFLDARNVFLDPLTRQLGFAEPRVVHLYRAARPDGGASSPPEPEPARPEHRAALEPLHDASFPNTWRTAGELLDGGLESRATFVHTIDGHFAGYIHVEADPAEESAQVPYLAVVPEFRGKGIGRRLLEQGLYWCFNERRAAAVSLTVFDGLANARALYESAGFQLQESGVTRRWRRE